MIVTPAEIALVNAGKRTAMLLPVELGGQGERLPCRVAKDSCVSLQPARFVKGTAITIDDTTRITLGDLTETHGRRLGYPTLKQLGGAVVSSRAVR